MRQVKDMNAVLTGTFLVLVALLAFYLARTLSGNTDVGLGPGYVPRMFATIQLLLGAALIATGLMARSASQSPEPWQLRPLVLVLASIGFFAISIERMGLIISVLGLVLLGCAANRGTTVKESVAMAIGSAVFAAVLFVKLLGLSIRLWP